MIRRHLQQGFTLIELIVIVVLVGIVASFLITFTQTRIANAPDVLLTSQREATAELVMERIMADYLVLINGANPEGALADIADNDYSATGATVTMSYITFDGSGAEQPAGGTSTTLKVTVAVNGENQKIMLLTTSRTNAGAAAGTEPVVNY